MSYSCLQWRWWWQILTLSKLSQFANQWRSFVASFATLKHEYTLDASIRVFDAVEWLFLCFQDDLWHSMEDGNAASEKKYFGPQGRWPRQFFKEILLRVRVNWCPLKRQHVNQPARARVKNKSHATWPWNTATSPIITTKWTTSPWRRLPNEGQERAFSLLRYLFIQVLEELWE